MDTQSEEIQIVFLNKFKELNMRVTISQIESYIWEQRQELEEVLISSYLTKEYNVFYTIKLITKTGINLEINELDKEYLEILQKPTTFAHAWELMDQGALMSSDVLTGFFTVKNGFLMRVNDKNYKVTLSNLICNSKWFLKGM